MGSKKGRDWCGEVSNVVAPMGPVVGHAAALVCIAPCLLLGRGSCWGLLGGWFMPIVVQSQKFKLKCSPQWTSSVPHLNSPLSVWPVPQQGSFHGSLSGHPSGGMQWFMEKCPSGVSLHILKECNSKQTISRVNAVVYNLYCWLLPAKLKNRTRQDSNLRGINPIDF